MNEKYEMGTYHLNLTSPMMQPRDKKGRYSGESRNLVMFVFLVAMLVLSTIEVIQSHELQDMRKYVHDTQKEMNTYVDHANKMVLDHTLGQIAQIEKQSADLNVDLYSMTQGSVDLTQNLKEQIVASRKLDALKK